MKLIKVILSLLLGMSLVGCSASEQKTVDDGKLKIVTTIFPVYDWTKQILSGVDTDTELTLLMDNGTDFHSYQPSAADMIQISDADIFVYVGGESENWVSDALKNATNKDMKVINLIDVLGQQVKTEEVIEGMTEESEDEEIDEHVWLSLKNAKIFTEAIRDAIIEKDETNASIYRANTDAYLSVLDAMDTSYQSLVDYVDQDTIVVGDRFPFRYLCDDYGLQYYAAFPGCSAETEASFYTIKFLADKLDEENLNSIITIDGSDQLLAITIIQTSKNPDRQVLTMNSMQSVTDKDDTSYIDIMSENLLTLEKVLRNL